MSIRLSWTLTVESPDGLVVTTSELTEADFTPTQRAALEHIIRHRGETPVPPAERRGFEGATAQALAGSPVPAGMNRNLGQDEAARRAALREAAKARGYTGEHCNNCLGFNTKRNGSCLCCDDCGQTTGCS